MTVSSVLMKSIKWLWNNTLNSGSQWEEVHVSSSIRPDATLRRFSCLRSKGIRCKLYNLNSPSGRVGYTGMVSLRVHKDDMVKARQLMRDVQN